MELIRYKHPVITPYGTNQPNPIKGCTKVYLKLTSIPGLSMLDLQWTK